MALADITINRSIITQLRKVILNDSISHAYLFIGDSKTRLQLGMEFAKAILCMQTNDDSCDNCTICRKVAHGNHEDLILIEKDENSVKVAAIERLMSFLTYKSIGPRAVVIVDDAHTMTVQAQNKLLKTLEEPLGNAVIILLSERKDALVETVVSRCSTYYLRESEYRESLEISKIAEEYLRLCSIKAPFYKTIEMLDTITSDRELCIEFLDVLEEKLRNALLIKSFVDGLTSIDIGPSFIEIVQSLELWWIGSAIIITEDCRKTLKQGYNMSYMLKQMCLRMNSRSITEE